MGLLLSDLDVATDQACDFVVIFLLLLLLILGVLTIDGRLRCF